MILLSQLTAIGHVGKPHGINGEINLYLDEDAFDAGLDIGALRCVVMDIDGIFVPFFINAVRPKTATTLLVVIDGIDTEAQAKELTGKTVYALAEEFDPAALRDPEDGLYAADLIGFEARDGETLLGTIDDIDDSTDNALFIISRPGDTKPLYVPIADEFIVEIDSENKIINLELPEGLLDL
ncbi:MAG: 16S rRNA processing protein RimM [Muribaculaceae bacterium]|nr:16S rRNA processing protein RimM [Muribaculaceae bacterium]